MRRATCRATFLRLVEIVGARRSGAPMRERIPITSMRQDAAHDRVLTSLAGAQLVSAEEDSLIVAHRVARDGVAASPKLAGGRRRGRARDEFARECGEHVVGGGWAPG